MNAKTFLGLAVMYGLMAVSIDCAAATIQQTSERVATVEEGISIVVIEGSLRDCLIKAKLLEATKLKLKGRIDRWEVLREMGKSTLNYLDLSEVTNDKIPANAFRECIMLETLIFPQNGRIRELPHDVCKQCDHLREVNVPEGVTVIDHHAFAKCTSVRKLVLPSTLTIVRAYCFEAFIALEEIHLRMKPIQWDGIPYQTPTNNGKLSGAFRGIQFPTIVKRLYVPTEYKVLYENPTLENLGVPAGSNINYYRWAGKKTVIIAE